MNAASGGKSLDLEASALRALKKNMRNEIDNRIKQLDDAHVAQESQAVMSLLLQSKEYKSARTIASYASFEKGELKTEAINTQILKDGKTLYLPYIVSADNWHPNKGAAKPRGSKQEMSMVSIPTVEEFLSLERDHWGIPTPHAKLGKDALEPDSPGIDLLLMPGVAFDGGGGRLGRGKGFYDRYLEKIDTWAEQHQGIKPITVGMALECQYFADKHEVPCVEHDRGVDAVITPNGWHWTHSS